MSVHRRRFSQEFKRAAARQVVEDGRSPAAVARDIGIRADQVRRAKGLAMRRSRAQQRRQLHQAIRRLRAELRVLERAAAVLSGHR